MTIEEAIAEFTYTGGEFTLSSGAKSSKYVDVRAAMLRYPLTFREHFFRQLPPGDIASWKRTVQLAGTGVSGAIILTLMRTLGYHGYLWNPKDHGVEWSPKPEPGTSVILVDDVATTGGTLQRLREACERAGLVVVGEVVAVRRNV